MRSPLTTARTGRWSGRGVLVALAAAATMPGLPQNASAQCPSGGAGGAAGGGTAGAGFSGFGGFARQARQFQQMQQMQMMQAQMQARMQARAQQQALAMMMAEQQRASAGGMETTTGQSRMTGLKSSRAARSATRTRGSYRDTGDRFASLRASQAERRAAFDERIAEREADLQRRRLIALR